MSPESLGSGRVIAYQVRWSATKGKSWSGFMNVKLQRSVTKAGLVKARSYMVQVRAINASGAGPTATLSFIQKR